MAWKMKPTRFPELSYSWVSRSEWSFFANDGNYPGDGGRVGPLYRSKGELLADLTRYARDSWGLEA